MNRAARRAQLREQQKAPPEAKATRDSFQNVAARLGIGTNNVSTDSTYGFNPVTRNRILLEFMYRGSWLVGQAVDCVAEDMTRAGIDLESDAPPEELDLVQKGLVELGIWTALEETIKWSRLYGGALAVILVDGQTNAVTQAYDSGLVDRPTAMKELRQSADVTGVWWLMTGDDIPPGKEIDHINRDRADNRWTNLRLVERSRNNHNSFPHRNNTSGVKGVRWVERDGKWDARIKVGGHLRLLGKFDRFEDAAAARVAAERRLLNESPTEMTGIPSSPAMPRRAKARWLDENRDEFRANRALVVRSTNKSGCPGVRLHKSSGLWQARIVVSGKETSLGYFKEMQAAIEARLTAELLYYGKTHKD